ncbi:MAG: metallophosphoesterase family protein [Prevotellaceae bacterium]|jgi:hypothetical protein|nr:metallophosphoesterase family protein [Prevotellaceae bacterium]
MNKKIIYLLIALVSQVNIVEVSGQNVSLRFRDGKFKIVQFTDIHYNPVSDKPREVDIEEIISRVLDAEKPDMVVYTGDIVTGKQDKQGWDKVLKPVIDRKIPYAVTLGNHDDEYGDWKRPQIAEYLEKQPFSLFQKGAKNIKGAGNFVLKVLNSNGKAAAVLYCMDSNAYGKVDDKKGWDWFDFNQVEWFRKISLKLTAGNGGKPYPALAFFHIPLQEYRMLFDTVSINYFERPAKLPVYGERLERECPGIFNTGMFAAMALAGDVMGTFVGHDHTNNYIGLLDGIALAYGCNTGVWNTLKSGGGRVIELHENQRSFDTWIRLASGEVKQQVNYPQSFILNK